jgi:hypothetical protein
VKHLLEGIPPLGERVKLLREREIARRGAAGENDIKSQTEYVAAVPRVRVMRCILTRRAEQVRARRQQLELQHGGLKGAQAQLTHCSCAGAGADNVHACICVAQAEASSGDAKRESPRSSATSGASADGVKVQQKGRFEVYDSEASASSEARADCCCALSPSCARRRTRRAHPRTPHAAPRRAPKCARGASWWRRGWLRMPTRCVAQRAAACVCLPRLSGCRGVAGRIRGRHRGERAGCRGAQARRAQRVVGRAQQPGLSTPAPGGRKAGAPAACAPPVRAPCNAMTKHRFESRIASDV